MSVRIHLAHRLAVLVLVTVSVSASAPTGAQPGPAGGSGLGPVTTATELAELANCAAAPPGPIDEIYVSSGIELWRLEASSGDATHIGTMTDGVTNYAGFDIAMGPTGVLYGSSPGTFFCADPLTAAVTVVGDHMTSINALDFDASGGLFAMGGSAFTPRDFFTVDTATGLATLVGPLGTTCISSGDLAFRPSDGTLFGALDCNGDDELVTIDPLTGDILAYVGTFMSADLQPKRDVWGLSFDSCNRLYAVDRNVLMEIDPTTGVSVRDVAIVTDGPLPFTSAYGLAIQRRATCCDAFAVAPASCEGEAVTLDGSASAQCSATGATYRWTEGATERCGWSTDPTCVVTPAATTTYTLEYDCLDPAGCDDDDDVTVHVVERPTADAGADVTVCAMGQVQLYGGDSVDHGCRGGLLYQWSEGATVWSPFRTSPWFTPPATGPGTTTYTLTVRCLSPESCDSSDDVTVVVERCPLAVGFDRVDAERIPGTDAVAVSWETSFEEGTIGFQVERLGDGAVTSIGAAVAARGPGYPYRVEDPAAPSERIRYRVVEVTAAGRGDVSPEVAVGPAAGAGRTSGRQRRWVRPPSLRRSP